MSESELDLSVTLPVEIVDENNLQPDDDRQIRELLCLCFPDGVEIFQHRRIWHNTSPAYSAVIRERGIRERGKIIGHTAVVVRTITTTWNFRYQVASIQGVCVAPDRRRVGLSRLLLQETIHEAARREFPFAILYCKEFMVPFYSSHGWKLADDSVVMWNTYDLPISMRSNCPMYYELADIPLPEGPLDVHSPAG